MQAGARLLQGRGQSLTCENPRLMMSMGKAIAAFRLPILRNDHSPPSLFTRSCPNQTTLGPVILALRLHSAVDTNMVLVDPA